MNIVNDISNTISKFLGLKSEKGSNTHKYENKERISYDNDIIKDILSEIKNLNVSDKNTQKDIENLRSLNLAMQVMMGIIIAAAGIFIPVVFNIHANRVDKAIENQTKMIETKIEAIEEQNALLIKFTINDEIKNTRKNK